MLADAWLKYCMMGLDPKSVAAMPENTVYFELRRKGCEVYMGRNETREIDLVAARRTYLRPGLPLRKEEMGAQFMIASRVLIDREPACRI